MGAVMARIILNQEFSYEMLRTSALLIEQIDNAIVTTNKMLSEIDSIGLSTCNLGELTFESLLGSKARFTKCNKQC